MRYDERALMLKDLAERLSDIVYVEIWDVLNSKLRLRDTETAVKSTVGSYREALEGIYFKLAEQVDELTLLSERAEDDASQAESAEEMFYAWEEGLCPLAVKAHPELKRYPYYGRVLEGISFYKNEDGLSYEDTEQAIERWKIEDQLDEALARGWRG